MHPEFESIATKAVQCRVCFEDRSIKPALIDIAQPRWVGPGYWSAKARVLMILLNPGSGESRKSSADARALELLREFRDGKGSLQAVLEHQAEDIPNWGRKRFAAFYLEGLGLKLDDVAFANFAWCSTKGNRYPGEMLRSCFARHTQQLIECLDPNVVLLSGTAVHRFANEIKNVIPGAEIIPTLHYAHRKGKAAEERELERVRGIIAEAAEGRTLRG